MKTHRHTAFSRHALLAGLLAVSLGTLTPLAASVVASADTTGPSAGQGAPATGGQTSAGGTGTVSSPAAGGPGTASGPEAGSSAPAPNATGGTSGRGSSRGKVSLATWFGPGFYGHATACGQRMTRTLVGVASRTLPCGTLVRIGYRGRRLTVPVLDRGPYGHNGAVWDLTTGAAQALEMADTAHITAQVVGRVPNAPTLGEAPTPGETPAATSGGGSPAPSSPATATGPGSAAPSSPATTTGPGSAAPSSPAPTTGGASTG